MSRGEAEGSSVKRVIRTWEDAVAHDKQTVAVVEVPGELVRLVFLLSKRLRSNDRKKRNVLSLLKTTAKLG